MVYLNLDEYLEFIFKNIRELAYDDNTKPSYESETTGLKQLSSILEFIQNNNLYPTFFNKASFLFLALSTGHKFNNGNKRLALFSYIYFSHRNKVKYKRKHKKTYIKWFKENFPKYKLSKQEFKSNVGWALFNFNKCINIKYPEKRNGHEYNFNGLKKVTEDFFKFISTKK